MTTQYNLDRIAIEDRFARASEALPRPRYMLVDGLTGIQICDYKAKSIALRDCAEKNAPLLPDRRFYVLNSRTKRRV